MKTTTNQTIHKSDNRHSLLSSGTLLSKRNDFSDYELTKEGYEYIKANLYELMNDTKRFATFMEQFKKK